MVALAPSGLEAMASSRRAVQPCLLVASGPFACQLLKAREILAIGLRANTIMASFRANPRTVRVRQPPLHRMQPERDSYAAKSLTNPSRQRHVIPCSKAASQLDCCRYAPVNPAIKHTKATLQIGDENALGGEVGTRNDAGFLQTLAFSNTAALNRI